MANYNRDERNESWGRDDERNMRGDDVGRRSRMRDEWMGDEDRSSGWRGRGGDEWDRGMREGRFGRDEGRGMSGEMRFGGRFGRDERDEGRFGRDERAHRDETMGRERGWGMGTRDNTMGGSEGSSWRGHQGAGYGSQGYASMYGQGYGQGYGQPSWGQGERGYGERGSGERGRGSMSYGQRPSWQGESWGGQRGGMGEGWGPQSYGGREGWEMESDQQSQGRMGYGGAGEYGGYGRAGGYGGGGMGASSYGMRTRGEEMEEQMRHRGRGPKGYTRSDERIKEEVCDTLTDHWAIDASDIEVQVKSGEVTLTGTVNSRQEKRLAEDVLEHLSGVKEVNNQLRVQRQGEQRMGSSTSGSDGRARPAPSSGASGASSGASGSGTNAQKM